VLFFSVGISFITNVILYRSTVIRFDG